jgi:hypothetical protein
MLLWRQLPAWLLRAWPLLALFPIGAFHAIALHEFQGAAQLVNKLMGMSLQVTGGLIILCSVNDNLGLFKSKSLIAVFSEWLRAFPLARKPVVVTFSGAAGIAIGGSAALSVGRAASSLEERVAKLEQELQSVRRELQNAVAEANRQLESAKEELGKRIGETHRQLNELNEKVERSAVGGIKFQFFGILLAVYGAVTSVFA